MVGYASCDEWSLRHMTLVLVVLRQVMVMACVLGKGEGSDCLPFLSCQETNDPTS